MNKFDVQNFIPRTHRRGFVVMDTLAGILLVLVLLMVMTVVMIKQERRERAMADTRAAARAAEGAMLALQAGVALSGGTNVEKLASPGVDGRVWLRVTATEHGRSANVVGLVEAGALPGSGGRHEK